MTARIRVSVSASRARVSRQSPSARCARSSAPGRCAVTPAGSGNAANTARMIRRHGRIPPHRGSSRRTAAVNRSRPRRRTRPRSPAHRTRHHRQRRAPAHRPERAPRCGQHRRPGAFGQIPDLVHRRRRAGRQLAAARPQVTQPRLHRIGPLRLITAQLTGQPRDQHRVLRVRLVPVRSSLSRARQAQQRPHAHQGQPPRGGELIQDPPPVPGRLARHRHRGKTRCRRPGHGPVQYLAQLPGPGTDPAAGDHRES